MEAADWLMVRDEEKKHMPASRKGWNESFLIFGVLSFSLSPPYYITSAWSTDLCYYTYLPIKRTYRQVNANAKTWRLPIL